MVFMDSGLLVALSRGMANDEDHHVNSAIFSSALNAMNGSSGSLPRKARGLGCGTSTTASSAFISISSSETATGSGTETSAASSGAVSTTGSSMNGTGGARSSGNEATSGPITMSTSA